MAHQPKPRPSTAVVHHLQGRVLETTDMRELLEELAAFSGVCLFDPAVTSCSITLLERAQPETAGSSGQRAVRLDRGQYEAGNGPCLVALRDQTTVHMPDVSIEDRWPDYRAAARTEGVRSSLSVPFLLEGGTGACLNLYSTESQGFSGQDIAMIQEYVIGASGALRLALRISRLSEVTDHLAADLDSPDVIGLATGVIMAQNSCDQATAVQILNLAARTRRMVIGDLAPLVLASIPDGVPGWSFPAEALSALGLASGRRVTR
jgi:GAF domain-containing protein